MAILSGIHAVTEALRASRPLEKILIARGAAGPRVQQVVDLARGAAVPVRFEDRASLDRASGSPAHQGVVAFGASQQYRDLEDLLEAKLLVILDGVEDPHNLGAIIRTADAVGAGGVIIPERRAAGLTETVAKSAAGALEYVPVARVVNVNRTLERLKEHGFWIYGLDERGTASYSEVSWNLPTAVVLGAEGKGLHEQVRKHCDVLIRIPMAGRIPSLNVSVAAGVVLFSWKQSSAQTGA